jgi:UDP-N-acetylmuramyl pentapeptide phosphotransferase/UDP-N-acetylglucosamine-1-phosphate transferase
MPQHLFLLALATLGLSAVSCLMVKAILAWTRRHRILDVPNERSSHTQPTPRGGGLAIVFLTILVYTAYAVFLPGRFPVCYIIAAGSIAVISFMDDLKEVCTAIRFFTHGIAAVIVLIFLGFWHYLTLPMFGEISLPAIVGIPVTFVWMVGMTNAYNFMDGIDGIAGGQAAVAGLGWIILGNISGQPGVALIGLLVLAGSLGFLWYNWPPARIFMGDVGSAFLGFTFAFLAVWAADKDSRMAAAGIILVWPFVFDSIFTLLRRLWKGENIFQAHCSHLYQRLVQNGWSHGKVSALYAMLAGIGILPAALFVRWPAAGSWSMLVLLPVLAGGLWLLVVYYEKQFT